MKRLLCYAAAAALAVVMAACTKPEAIKVTGVELDHKTLTVTAGDKTKLTATISPADAENRNIKWTSSAPTVATVGDDGMVTAWKEGSATITVKTDDGGFTADCEVTVKPQDPDAVRVTGVTLDHETLTITAGQTAELKPTVAPEKADNKKVTWSSSDETVATVVDGLVTALKEGSATITVKTDDGGFPANCAVTVEKAVVKVTGVELDKKTLIIAAGEQSKLTATISPKDAEEKGMSWDSSNEAVAIVGDDGTVTGKGAGTTTITVTTKDGEFKASATVTVEGVLIDGVIWAEFNVEMPGKFVAATEQPGMLYKWGTKIGWSSADPMTDSNGGTDWDKTVVEGATWPEEANPCPAGWRVPTKAEIQKMGVLGKGGSAATENDNVRWEYIAGDAVKGTRYTDKKLGTSIFLPAAGYRMNNGGVLMNPNRLGRYWSSESPAAEAPDKSNVDAYYIEFDQYTGKSGDLMTKFDINGIMIHAVAHSIRCVK